MQRKYPGYQNMISRDPPKVIIRRHQEHLAYRQATDADCHVEQLQETVGLDAKQGFRSTYQLHWATYIGWKVYMQHTGCYACDLAEEKELEQNHGKSPE